MSDAARQAGNHSRSAPRASRQAFADWVREGGEAGRDFLQLWIRAIGKDRYEIRHRADRTQPESLLEEHRDPYAARELARTTEAGEHRPLRTSPNLRRGWVVSALNEAGLVTAMEYFYPAGMAHWHAGRTGTLRVTDWPETAARQSGIYSAVRLLPSHAVRNTVQACCADEVCLRTVAWRVGDDSPPPPAARGGHDGARLPCPEACSLFISLAREVLRIEREPRQAVGELGDLSSVEVAQLREIVLAAADGTLYSVREGDFGEATNERRVRYLAARLRTGSTAMNGSD